jgi:SAM-dependent methyltransferase
MPVPTSTSLTRYVHPRAVIDGAQHDWGLDVVSDVVQNYPRWVAGLCQPFLGQSVLEVGAGFGAVTQHFEADRIVAVDSSPACVAAMTERFDDRPEIEIVEGDLRTLDFAERFDSVVMINTLEHIPDDVAAVRSMAGHLRPGGRLVVYVPALNGLYSDFDRKVGHCRRYSKPMLRAVMGEAGLAVAELRYVNLLGVPAWFAFTKVLRREPSEGWAAERWDRTGPRRAAGSKSGCACRSG